MRSLLGFALHASHLLGRNTETLISFKTISEKKNTESRGCFLPNTLKEIALPTYSLASNGSNILERLGRSNLHRPVSGLYQYPSGLCVRPLPAAAADRRLSSPSLVFQCESLERRARYLDECASFTISRVGQTGARVGQLIVQHRDFVGFDVRLCESTSYSSMFAEAQESLMAGSLPELQSKHVLDGVQGTDDPNTDRMDCWVEFRANMKNPGGFLPPR